MAQSAWFVFEFGARWIEDALKTSGAILDFIFLLRKCIGTLFRAYANPETYRLGLIGSFMASNQVISTPAATNQCRIDFRFSLRRCRNLIFLVL